MTTSPALLDDIHHAHVRLRTALDALAHTGTSHTKAHLTRVRSEARDSANSVLVLVSGLDESEESNRIRAATVEMCAELAHYSSEASTRRRR